MYDSIEDVNAHIAAKTASLVKVTVVNDPAAPMPGVSVQLFAADVAGEPVVEFATYDPGTPIDSEHAALIEEAPDLVKILHGDPDDITTTSVVQLDLSDGAIGDGVNVDDDSVNDEAPDHASHGVSVESFAEEVLAVDPDAGRKLVDANTSLGRGQTTSAVILDDSPFQNELPQKILDEADHAASAEKLVGEDGPL